MDQKLRLARLAALLGVVVAVALLPVSAAALSAARQDASPPPVAGPIPSSLSAPHATFLGSVALAVPAQLQEDRQGYDSKYLFSLSRGLANSTVVTPLKPPLFIFTIPLDIALLPFAAIAGFF